MSTIEKISNSCMPQISAESYRLNCSDTDDFSEEISCRMIAGNPEDNNYFKVGEHKIPKQPEYKTLGDAFSDIKK